MPTYTIRGTRIAHVIEICEVVVEAETENEAFMKADLNVKWEAVETIDCTNEEFDVILEQDLEPPANDA